MLKSKQRQVVAIFRWTLKISNMFNILIMPQNFAKISGFQLQILYYWTKIFGQKRFFDSPKSEKGFNPYSLS